MLLFYLSAPLPDHVQSWNLLISFNSFLFIENDSFVSSACFVTFFQKILLFLLNHSFMKPRYSFFWYPKVYIWLQYFIWPFFASSNTFSLPSVPWWPGTQTSFIPTEFSVFRCKYICIPWFSVALLLTVLVLCKIEWTPLWYTFTA